MRVEDVCFPLFCCQLTASDVRHVALLKIQGRDYQMDPIQLKTVRPFVYGDIALEEAREEGAKLDSKVAVNKFLKSKVKYGACCNRAHIRAAHCGC